MGKEGPSDPREYDTYWDRFISVFINAIDKPGTWIRGEDTKFEVPGNLPILEVTELRNNTSVFCQGSNMSAIFAGGKEFLIAQHGEMSRFRTLLTC